MPKIAINLNRSARNLNKLIRSVDPDLVEDAMADVDIILDNAVSASEQANTAITTVNREALVELVAALQEAQKATTQLSQLIATANAATDDASLKVGNILTEVDDFSRDGGDQLLTTLDRLDRAALNIEEMTNILRNNPGVLITGTE